MKRQSPDTSYLYKEQLAYIGQLLREVREESLLSYEQLSEQTLIRPSLLQAIERADVHQLPEPVYTRALIRRFGDSLELDGEALASQYFVPSHGSRSGAFWRFSLMPQLRPLHLYMIYAALIAIAISALSYTLRSTIDAASTLPVLDGEAAEQAMTPKADDSVASNEAATVTSESASAAAAAGKPVRVAVKMEDQSWLRVTADGEVVFEGILKEGDDRLWTAKELIVIRSGNAGGVVASFNDGPAEALGQPGMVTEVAYPPEDTASL